MWNSSSLFFMFVVGFTVILAEFPSNKQKSLSQDSNIREKNTKSFPNSFNKLFEGLIPSNLRPFSGLLLGSLETGSIFQSVAGNIIPTARYSTQISQQCREDSWFYAESLMNFTEWALKMYDASGKIPDGILSGNFHSLGHFDQCLKVRYGYENNSSTKFTGKYCPVFLLPKVVLKRNLTRPTRKSIFNSTSLIKAMSNIEPEKLENFDARTIPTVFPNLAFCLPSSCSASDIETGVHDLIGSIGGDLIEGIQIFPYTTEDFCTAGDVQRNFDVATVTAMLVYSLLIFFLIMGTAYDAFLRNKFEDSEEKLQTSQRILLSFSLIKNGAQVLDTRNVSEGNLDCLHGIRFFSMTWIVLGHTWTMYIENMNANAPLAREDGRYWAYQALSNYTVPVDTFFFLSGLLVAYVTLRELDKRKGKLNFFSMYLHRFLRLTPVYAFILLFIATLLPHLGSGPFWGNVVLMSKKCGNVWWQHLLYVNNFFKGGFDRRDCMAESWYLAVDMQMFLLSPFFIYTLWRRHKFGIFLVIWGIVTCTAITVVIVATNNMPPTYINFATDNPFRLQKFFDKYYVIPWCRIMPYLVGILMGYTFHRLRNQVIKMNACIVFTGWLAATAIALAVVYGLAGYFAESEVPVFPPAVSVLYASLHRTAWAVSLSWLVFACVQGYGGFVNEFLSWSIFRPLSRLAYCTYLIHFNFIKFHYGNVRSVPYYTTTDMLLQFVANLVVSMGLAFIATVCIETPFVRLEKLLFTDKSNAEKKTNKI